MTTSEVQILINELQGLRQDVNTRFSALNDRVANLEKMVRWAATKEDLRELSLALNSGHDAKHEKHLRIDHSSCRRMDDPDEIDMTSVRSAPKEDDTLQMLWAFRMVRWAVVAAASSAITVGVIELMKDHPWK